MKFKRTHNSTTELPASLTNKLDQPRGPAGGGVQDDGRFSTKKLKKSHAGNRKQARKQARQDKKQRKQQVYKRSHGFAVEDEPKKEPVKKKQPIKEISRVDEKTKLAHFAKHNEAAYKLLRKSNLVEDVDKEAGIVVGSDDVEDREMRRLERNLGIKRGDKLENAFFDEGLGELFDGIEVGSASVQNEEEEESEEELVEDSELDSDVAEMYESQAVDTNPTLEITDEPTSNKYMPPSLRRRMQEAQDATDPRVQSIRKALQGQLNRLSETNIDGILGQIETQYQNHPRQLVTDALTDLILQSVQSRIHMLDTFLYVNAALVGAVHRAVGLEPVAFLVQRLMEEFEKSFREQTGEGKECQNLCVFMAELYNFQVISCQLVYDVIRMCVEEVNEFTAELLLKLVRVSGVQLRKDDPLALKEIVQRVNQQSTGKGKGKLSVRCQFMVESLTNLRDNRLRNTMSANAENVSRLKKFLGNMDKRRSVGAVEPINIGMQDIREIKTRGKWWLVGASWVGNQHLAEDDDQRVAELQAREEATATGNSEMERLLRMAKEQRMNTDVRRSIFVTLLSSDDYVDAFERLLKLDLKRTQVREVVRVLLHCCGQEAVYNPYYTLVALKLCSHHSSYRLTMQYALWDFMRELGETDVGGLGRIAEEEEEGGSAGERVPVRRVVNLAKLYGWLVDKGSLSLLVLKTVTFAKVGGQARVFFQMFFAAIFLQHQAQTAKDEDHLAEVFGRAAANPALCHGILFFFHHFVKRSELVKDEERPTMKWGCKLVKQVFRSSASRI